MILFELGEVHESRTAWLIRSGESEEIKQNCCLPHVAIIQRLCALINLRQAGSSDFLAAMLSVQPSCTLAVQRWQRDPFFGLLRISVHGFSRIKTKAPSCCKLPQV